MSNKNNRRAQAPQRKAPVKNVKRPQAAKPAQAQAAAGQNPAGSDGGSSRLKEDFIFLFANYFTKRPTSAFARAYSLSFYLILMLANIIAYGLANASCSYFMLKHKSTATAAVEKGITYFEPTAKEFIQSMLNNAFAQLVCFLLIILMFYIFGMILDMEKSMPIFFGLPVSAISSLPSTVLLLAITLIAVFLPFFATKLLMVPFVLFMMTLYRCFRGTYVSKDDPYWLFVLLILVCRLITAYFPMIFVK